MKKLLAFCIVTILAPYMAWGQSSEPFVFHSGATADGDGSVMNASYYSTIVVQIEGTFTGEIFFEKKTKDATGWVAVQCTNASDRTVSATSATETGYWECPGGTYNFRARADWGSGTIVVTGHGSTAVSRSSGGGGGGSGTVTSVDASGGLETVSGSAITSTGTIRGTLCVKHVTTTTYTVLTGDRACLVVFANADPIAVTLPEAGTTGFEDKWFFQPVNDGAGTVTITPTTSTIQGGSYLDLTTGKGVTIASDGTNYVHNPGLGLTSEAQGLPDVIAINRTFGGAVSAATGPQFGSSATGRYWVPFDDPTEGLIFDCVVATVLGDCDKGVKIYTGHVWDFKNNSGTSIGRLTESTGAWTNFKLDLEANTITMPFWWDLDLCGLSPTDGTTVAHIWNEDPLSTAPTLLAASGTNRGTCKLTFPDSDGDYGVQISRQIPDGTLTGNFDMDVWWDTTGTGNARFQVQTKCYAGGEADDDAFNTASVVTAAAGTSGRPNKQTLTGVTVTGCAGGELMRIRFYRNRTEASDTLNAALNVEKVVFKGRVIP